MTDWKEIGHVNELLVCPKCGGFLLLERADAGLYATCCECLAMFIRQETFDAESYIANGLQTTEYGGQMKSLSTVSTNSNVK